MHKFYLTICIINILFKLDHIPLQYLPFLGLNNSVHQNWTLQWLISPCFLKEEEEEKHRKFLLTGFGNSIYSFCYFKPSGRGYH